jgi:alpha-tubulin suppressor-like RCC1 family protein
MSEQSTPLGAHMRWVRTLMAVGLLVLATSGCSAYGWSYYNSLGEAGDGTTTPRLAPVATAGGIDWLNVDAGYYHSCGVEVHKQLYCWGNNTRGELGLGTTGSIKTVPTRVGADATWSDVSAGGASSGQSFTCGIRAGALLCWGYNLNGQLGLGNTTNRSTPTQVGTATDWSAVEAGAFTSCATKSSGALYCWGAGGGAIGDGSTSMRLAPVRVGMATDWKSVSVGGAHACGVRGSALYCWGQNSIGQLGLGSAVQMVYTTPQLVAPSLAWTQVAAGDFHTCAVGDAKLYCWGSNTSGELGRGTFDPIDPFTGDIPPNPTPKQVGTATDWTMAATGEGASCGIRTGGLLYCWGNTPLGDGTTDIRALPTKVAIEGWVSISMGVLHKTGIRLAG